MSRRTGKAAWEHRTVMPPGAWRMLACALIKKAGGEVTLTIEELESAEFIRPLGLRSKDAPDRIRFTLIPWNNEGKNN